MNKANITVPTGSINQVDFYADWNNHFRIEAGVTPDEFLGMDFGEPDDTVNNRYTITYNNTAAIPPGTYTIYGVVVATAGSNPEGLAREALATIRVNAPPQIASISTAASVQKGTTTTVIVTAVDDLAVTGVTVFADLDQSGTVNARRYQLRRGHACQWSLDEAGRYDTAATGQGVLPCRRQRWRRCQYDRWAVFDPHFAASPGVRVADRFEQRPGGRDVEFLSDPRFAGPDGDWHSRVCLPAKKLSSDSAA